MTPDETAAALKIFSADKGVFNEDKHFHNPQTIKKLIESKLPKYVFTCSSMQNYGLCHGCKKWFYLKLNFPDEYYKRIKNKRS